MNYYQEVFTMLPSLFRNTRSHYRPATENYFDRYFYRWPSLENEADAAWAPLVDINETDKEVTLDVELPGFEKKDVKVEVRDNTLTISGERTNEKKTDDNYCSRVERHYGKFERTFTLSDEVDANKISAKYKNGVLSLALTKTEKAIPKEITVEVK